MKFVKIENAALNGSVVLPPSKSAAQRAVICSFLAGGGSVEPIIGSKDMQAAEMSLLSVRDVCRRDRSASI